MATNPSLPEEVILEIISRLTMGKCKCLSKSYLSIISKPQFLNLYLTHHPNLILITPAHSLNLVLSTRLLNNNAVSKKLELPGSWTQVIGSCKGLVLLTDKQGDLYLVNPFTTEMSKIPHFDLSLNKDESDRSHGFGYDESSGDYKIVTLSFDRNLSCRGIFVDVYSVKMGVWKRCDKFPFERFMLAMDPLVSGVYVDGAIHWLTCTLYCGRGIVAKFDLAKEVFYDVATPEFLHGYYKSLVGRSGRLCGVSSYYRLGGGDVWTLEEYGSMEELGLVDSWKKFTIPGNEESVVGLMEFWNNSTSPGNKDEPKVKPVCFVGEDGIVLRAEDGRLFMYDVNEGKMKEFLVDGVPACCMDMGMGSFVDGLV